MKGIYNMANTFEFIGRIVPCKKTDKFNPCGIDEFPKGGWGKKYIKFNVVSGFNRHMVEVSTLVNVTNPNSQSIYTFTKGEVNSDGTRGKGSSLAVPFDDRLNQDIIEQVAGFRKFVVDTEITGRRTKLENALNNFKEGTITDEEMAELNVNSLKECEEALEKSNNRKHEFISEYDFIDCLEKILSSDKIKNMKFKVTGDYTLEYSDKKDAWYRHFNVKRVYRVADSTEDVSQANFDFVFKEDCVDDSKFEDTKKMKVAGYIPQYLSQFKGTFFAPFEFTLDGGANKKKALAFKKKFDFPVEYEGEYREIGIVCDVLNGSPTVELTEDMLTAEQKENLEYGFCTMEDIKSEINKDIKGEKVVDLVISKLARGYSNGSEPTVYKADDFCKPHNKELKNIDEDIFADDDI